MAVQTCKAFLVGEILGRHELLGQRGFADTMATDNQHFVGARSDIFRRFVSTVQPLASRWTRSRNMANGQMMT